CFIAFSIAATDSLPSPSLPVLVRGPVLCGALYGVFVYFFMNRIVIPLSAIGVSTFSLAVFVNCIAIHILGIGMPAALLVARAPAPLSPAAGVAAHVRPCRLRPLPPLHGRGPLPPSPPAGI